MRVRKRFSAAAAAVVAAMAASFAPSEGHASAVLIFGDNPGDQANLRTALESLGHTVTNVSGLPDDLSGFDTVWHVRIFSPLTASEQARLSAFLAGGGGVHFTGERPCCEDSNASIQSLLNAVVAGGGIAVGGQGDPTGPFAFNPGARGGVATTPNALGAWSPTGPGGMLGVSAGNVLATATATGEVVGAVYDSGDLVAGAGRITVLMDTGWYSADPNRLAAVENIQTFLDGGRGADRYLLYDVETAQDDGDGAVGVVSLSDQFDEADQSRLFEVDEVERLGNPVDVSGEGIDDPDTHLVAYEIDRVWGEPRHRRLTGILVTNEFGEIKLDTVEPVLLLVPSVTDLARPIEVVPERFPVDYFKCYEVRVTEDTPDFQKVRVSVLDEFEQPTALDVTRPRWLCNPASKDGGGIGDPGGHLLCYRVRRAEGEQEFAKVTGIHAGNRFGPLRLDARREKELCVPSEKDLTNAVPLPREDDDD